MPLTKEQWNKLCKVFHSSPYDQCQCQLGSAVTMISPEKYDEKFKLGHIMEILNLPSETSLTANLRLVAIGCPSCGSVKFMPAKWADI
jgi:hypothetical protein